MNDYIDDCLLVVACNCSLNDYCSLYYFFVAKKALIRIEEYSKKMNQSVRTYVFVTVKF